MVLYHYISLHHYSILHYITLHYYRNVVLHITIYTTISLITITSLVIMPTGIHYITILHYTILYYHYRRRGGPPSPTGPRRAPPRSRAAPRTNRHLGLIHPLICLFSSKRPFSLFIYYQKGQKKEPRCAPDY